MNEQLLKLTITALDICQRAGKFGNAIFSNLIDNYILGHFGIGG